MYHLFANRWGCYKIWLSKCYVWIDRLACGYNICMWDMWSECAKKVGQIEMNICIIRKTITLVNIIGTKGCTCCSFCTSAIIMKTIIPIKYYRNENIHVAHFVSLQQKYIFFLFYYVRFKFFCWNKDHRDSNSLKLKVCPSRQILVLGMKVFNKTFFLF